MEISEDDVEIVIDDLQMALGDLLENGPNDDDYDRINEILRDIDSMVDQLMGNDNA